MPDLLAILPAKHCPRVTPDDDASLQRELDFPKGLSLGAAGTLRITDLAGEVQDFEAGELAAGVIHPIRAAKIHATGTSATAIRVYY